MLIIENLRKKLSHFDLEIDRLEIKNKDYFVLLGLSGSGKTTLLEIIAGFTPLDQGRILLNGEDITKLPIHKKKITLCHGKYLFPHLTVEQNIGYGLRGQKNKVEIIKTISTDLNIAHLLPRKVKQLSMGEQQRVALARAMAIRPKLLLLDEPLNALDRLTHEEFLFILKKIHEQTGLTFFHVTHDFVEAIFLANKIGIIKRGKIQQLGEIDKVINQPKNKFVAKFVGVNNVIEGKVEAHNNQKFFCSNHFKIKVDPNCPLGRSSLGIRPDQILLISNKNCKYLNQENTFEAKILGISPLSLATLKVFLEVKGLVLVAEMLRSKAEWMSLFAGKKVLICINKLIYLGKEKLRV